MDKKYVIGGLAVIGAATLAGVAAITILTLKKRAEEAAEPQDSIRLDLDGDGVADVVLEDLDGDGKIDTVTAEVAAEEPTKEAPAEAPAAPEEPQPEAPTAPEAPAEAE